jgi:type VI secretion system protein ImpJ
VSDRSRIVWSEGLLLRSQHFQQHDRWVEGLVRGATAGLRGNAWGLRELELDPGLLAQGKIALRRCNGILPDGTSFAIPDGSPSPDPLPIGIGAAPLVVHLCLPVELTGASTIDPIGHPPSGVRYVAREVEVNDTLVEATGTAALHVAEPRFRLLADSDARDAFVSLPIAAVLSLEAEGRLLMDNEFLPPCLRLGASPWLASFIDEVQGIVANIAGERAAFVSGKRPQGAADITDLLILSACNRALATARHLAAQRSAHPEDVYRWLLELLAEATTFCTAGSLVAPEIEAYRHTEPWRAFRPLIAELRRVLLELARPERKAVQIPLRKLGNGVLAAEVQDRKLFADAVFYIAVEAPVPAERVRRQLPGQVTIGPAEDLHSMVTSAVPGIRIAHVPSVPREIPLHRDHVYFELERQNTYWRRLPQAAGLAFSINGDLREGLEMECWAVRA